MLARRFAKFDAQAATDLMARHGVRNVFLPPTALKLMRQAGIDASGVKLRTLASGGETLGAELLDWGRATFGVTIHEFYGQTECNLVVGNDASLMPVRPGSMGRAFPGHRVAVIDEAGSELPVGEVGAIAVARPDPVMFLRYWNNGGGDCEEVHRRLAADRRSGAQDADGYFWYVGRDDDVITSAGYRIGPGEIEECLMKHPSVALGRAVIGAPDPVRTEVVMAYLVLRSGHAPLRYAAGGDSGFRADAAGGVRVSAAGGLRGRVADDHDGQDHAAGAAPDGDDADGRAKIGSR